MTISSGLCLFRAIVVLLHGKTILQDGPVQWGRINSNRRWECLIKSTDHCERNNLLNFDRSALALEAAINGHGVAIATTYMIDDDLAAERLVEIWRNPDDSGEYLFMSWAAQRTTRNPVMQTVNWILSEFGLEATHL